MQKRNYLRQLGLFENVAQETVDTLWLQGKVEEYSKNTVLMRAREPVTNIYIQLTGKSIVYNLTHTGQRKILFILGKGELLNEHIFNTHVGALFCETIEKSKVFVIPSEAFTNLMAQDFSLTQAVVEAQEKKIWRLGHQLKNTMGSIYMERKLAAKLWKLARDFGRETPDGIEIDINMTITFLADMLGAPRETTSRLCSTLTDYGLLKVNKKRIIIVNPQKMSHFYKTGKIE